MCKEKKWENRVYFSNTASFSTKWCKECLFPAKVIPKHLLYSLLKKQQTSCCLGGLIKEKQMFKLKMLNPSSALLTHGGLQWPPAPQKGQAGTGRGLVLPVLLFLGSWSLQVESRSTLANACLCHHPPFITHTKSRRGPERNHIMRFEQEVRFIIK